MEEKLLPLQVLPCPEDWLGYKIYNFGKSLFVFSDHDDLHRLFQQKVALLVPLVVLNIPVDDGIRSGEHSPDRFDHIGDFFPEAPRLDGEEPSPEEVVDLDGQEKDMLLGLQAFVEVYKLLEHYEIGAFGQEREHQREEALLEDERIAELVVEFLRVRSNEQFLLYNCCQ